MSDRYENDEDVDQWEEVADYELPSANEAKSSKYDFDPVPDGIYHVAIEDISKRLDNNFNPDVDRRAFTFRILRDIEGEDESLVGARFRQYMNVTSHPKGALYPYFKAAAGGNLEPDERPQLISLRYAQVTGTLVTEENENGNEKQVFKGIKPVKKKLPYQGKPPF